MKQKTLNLTWFIGLIALFVLYAVCFSHMMMVFRSTAGTFDTVFDVVGYDAIGLGCFAGMFAAFEAKHRALIGRVLLVILSLLIAGFIVFLNILSLSVA